MPLRRPVVWDCCSCLSFLACEFSFRTVLSFDDQPIPIVRKDLENFILLARCLNADPASRIEGPFALGGGGTVRGAASNSGHMSIGAKLISRTSAGRGQLVGGGSENHPARFVLFMCMDPASVQPRFIELGLHNSTTSAFLEEHGDRIRLSTITLP